MVSHWDSLGAKGVLKHTRHVPSKMLPDNCWKELPCKCYSWSPQLIAQMSGNCNVVCLMFNNTSPTQDEITDESGTRENTEVIYPNTTVEVGMYMSKTPWTQMVIVWRKEIPCPPHPHTRTAVLQKTTLWRTSTHLELGCQKQKKNFSFYK